MRFFTIVFFFVAGFLTASLSPSEYYYGNGVIVIKSVTDLGACRIISLNEGKVYVSKTARVVFLNNRHALMDPAHPDISIALNKMELVE